MGITAGVLVTVVALTPLPLEDLDHLGHVQAATVAVIAAELLVVLGLWLRPHDRRWLWASGAALLAATLWWMPTRLNMCVLNWWAPGFWAVAWVCWAVALTRRTTFGLVTGAALLALTVLDPLTTWLAGVPITRARLSPVPWFTMPVAMMALFGYGLDLLAVQADHQIERRRRAELDRDTERLRSDTRREAARLLHDHVLHALHALSREPGQVPVELVREDCRTAVGAAETARGEQPMARVEELVEADAAARDARVTVHGSTDPLPHEVAQALAAATHEALVNALRHSRAAHIRVELAQRGPQWQVEVRDDGRGFDSSRILANGRLGLKHSVQERLEDAGGLSEVDSEPGRGTTVHLAWPALDDSAAAAWPRMGNKVLGRMLSRTAWPALAITPLMALLSSDALHPAWPVQLAGLALMALGLWWLRRIDSHEMTMAGAVAIFVVTTLAWWLNLALAPQPTRLAQSLWIGWTAGGLVHFAVLQLPWRRGAAMLGLWATAQLMALVACFGWAEGLRLHIALDTVVGEGTIALVALRVAHQVMDENATQAQVADALRRQASRFHAASHVEQFWSARVTEVALPLLHEVAEGRRDPDNAQVVAQARQLEATLRDELVLGPSRVRFVDALGRLRQLGWTVGSSIDDSHPVEQLEAFADLLDRLEAPARPGQELVLSSSAGQGVALALAPDDEQCRHWKALANGPGLTCQVDPDFARLAMGWSTPRR